MRADRDRRIQLDHHMRPFSRWRWRVFRRAPAESVFGLGRRAVVDCKFHRYRSLERMGRRNLSRRANAIANPTGVMKLDANATLEAPKVTRTATKAILFVAIEVVAGTALLGW